jgi:ABC-type multidrug transport system permease subunit
MNMSNQPPSYDPDRSQDYGSTSEPQSYGSAPEPQSYGSAPEPQSYGSAPEYQQQPVYAPHGAYGQPYGALPEHPQGTTILVLGIVGLFVTICAPIAWYMGSKAQKEIAASGMRYANEQNINIGKILGMVLTILAIVGIAIAIVFIVIAVIAAVASS